MNANLARTLSACAFFGAVLVLSACTKTRTVTVGDQAAVQAAEAALTLSVTSLARAQNALGAATNPAQRMEARTAVDAAQRNLAMVQENLEAQPNSAAKTAVGTALMAIDTALVAVSEALGATNTALGSGGEGGISFVSMHTSLDRAQTALDTAQAELRRALEVLEANPDAALSALLAQAQATLTTAQVSLIPELRRELAEARAARDAAPPPPPPPTEEEAALRSARTGLTEAQAATGQAGTALASAQAALEKVEADFQATARAWTADTTDEQKMADREAAQMRRQAAQTALATAWEAFVNARKAERTAAAALATAAAAALDAAGTDEQRTAEANAGAAMAAETPSRAWTATRIAADPGLAAPPVVLTSTPPLVPPSAPAIPGAAPFTARVTLTPREDAFSECTVNMPCPNPDPLDIAKEAVPWAAGKTVLSPGATGDGDHFPLRAISMRGDIRHSYEGDTEDSASGTTPKVPVVQSKTDIDGTTVTGAGITRYQLHYQNPVTSSIRFTPDGMVFRTGGEGAVFGLFKHDLDRSSGSGRDGINSPGAWGTTDSGNSVTSDDCSGAYPAYCFDFNRNDAEISWGAPYADPDGEPNYYWVSRYGLSGNQPQPDPGDNDGRLLAKHGALGDLRVWLSNHGGRADADDDADRYLSYAAYGLFVYTDYVTEFPRAGLFQGFHFGYDAFRNEANMRATERANSIEATFRGRTMGMILHPAQTSVGTEDRPQVGHFTRLRGDVTLNACIGAGTCSGAGIPTNANKIMGNIANLQVLENGIWQNYRFLTNADGSHPIHPGSAILLRETGIEADGSYKGQTDTWDNHWNRGEYSGALYGPTDKLETAGWWRIETDSSHQDRHSAAFGSFGACQPEHCRVPAPSN